MTKSDWKSFFDRDFLKNTLASLGGALSALLIYYLLDRLDKKKVNKLAAEKDGRRLMYLGGLLEAGKSQSELFLGNLNHLIEDMKGGPLYFPSLAPMNQQHLQRLSGLLNNEDYFEAYIDQFGEEHMGVYHEMTSSVDFFIAQESDLRDLLALAQDEDLKCKSVYISMVYDLLKRGSEVLQLVSLTGTEGHDQIKSIYDKYHTAFTSYEDLPYHQDYFIRPMVEEIFAGVPMEEPVLLELSTAFKAAHNLYQEIDKKQSEMQAKLAELLEVYRNRAQLFSQQAEPLTKRLEESETEEKKKKKD